MGLPGHGRPAAVRELCLEGLPVRAVVADDPEQARAFRRAFTGFDRLRPSAGRRAAPNTGHDAGIVRHRGRSGRRSHNARRASSLARRMRVARRTPGATNPRQRQADPRRITWAALRLATLARSVAMSGSQAPRLDTTSGRRRCMRSCRRNGPGRRRPPRGCSVRAAATIAGDAITRPMKAIWNGTVVAESDDHGGGRQQPLPGERARAPPYVVASNHPQQRQRQGPSALLQPARRRRPEADVVWATPGHSTARQRSRGRVAFGKGVQVV